jgi:hypothetical protein
VLSARFCERSKKNEYRPYHWKLKGSVSSSGHCDTHVLTPLIREGLHILYLIPYSSFASTPASGGGKRFATALSVRFKSFKSALEEISILFSVKTLGKYLVFKSVQCRFDPTIAYQLISDLLLKTVF